MKSRPAPAKPGSAGAWSYLRNRWVWITAGVAVLGGGALAAAAVHVPQRLMAAAQASIVERSAAMGLTVQSVRLEGASPRARADILRAAALPKGAPLLTLDLDGVRRRVEQVGWVKSAKVMRLAPDSVVIAVDERKLTAVWQHDGRTAVVDDGGVAAPEADPAKFASLPLVVGEGANTAAAAILPAVESRPRLTQRLDALVRVDDRRWDLRLKDGSIIQLPASDEEAALMRLDQLDQQSHVLDLGFSRIDLRDPEMVAVRPRQGAPAAHGATGGAG